MQPEISCQHVRKIFGKGTAAFEAVTAATFSIEKGEFVCLLGPSGCGKSTLLMMIAGLEAVTDGRILAGGALMTEPRAEIGIVFQDPTLLPWKTTLQNILFPIEMMRRDRSAYLPRAMELIRLVHLDDAVHKRPRQLSGGMRQRVSIARAFANDPEVLLMDEPFSALDEQNRTILQQELLRIWEVDKKTVVFITHSVDEAVTLADKIMVMTASPGRAKTIIDVTLERPRNVLELRNDPRYGKIVYGIWGHLKDEVERARL